MINILGYYYIVRFNSKTLSDEQTTPEGNQDFIIRIPDNKIISDQNTEFKSTDDSNKEVSLIVVSWNNMIILLCYKS